MSMHSTHFGQERTKSKLISHFDTPNKASSSTSESKVDEIAQSKKYPIKVVDVNKLLKFPKSDEQKMSHLNEDKNVKKFAALTRPCDLSSVTISHVLSCFKEMLPSKFDLSRLIPNDKLTTLVIRYLKLNNDDASQALVKGYLKIIIDASKATDTTFGDYTKHPYLNVEDPALQAALVKVLPRDFSMVDVTNQVLQCLCVVLNIGVFSDGFHFLRTQIRKFTAEGQQFNQIMNQASAKEITTISSNSSLIRDSEVSTETKSQTKNNQQCPPTNGKGPKIKNWPPLNVKTLKIKNWPPLKCNTFTPQNKLESSQAKINVNPQISRTNHLQFTTKVTPDKRNIDTQPKELFTLEGILTYLKIKKCSARDVLANFSLMFNLCRHLRIKSRQSNLQKIKVILNLIEAKNIDTSNFKQHKKELDQLKFLKNKKECHVMAYAVTNDIKLRSNPIVVIENITDFAKEQMLFMRKNSRSLKYDDYFHSKQMSPIAQSYSSEQVRKITSDSYKEFRKIVMKRNGLKVWFQLKFSALPLGTEVFIKDFRNPALGWEKGTVKQKKGPFRFLIKLHRGVDKWCVPDQIRPCPKKCCSTGTRPQRPVKPKQLLNL